MTRFEVPQKWAGMDETHECGPCYACCVWLGIEELKKYTGQTCKRLVGGHDPSKRCTIYEDRPKACREYQCLWRAGWGPQELRPYESGILITGYPPDPGPPDMVAFTVNVFDQAKAQPHIMSVVGELTCLPFTYEVRLVFIQKKKATLFREGLVYDAILLPPEGFESLIFQADISRPVGRYEVKHEPPDRPRDLQEHGPEQQSSTEGG